MALSTTIKSIQDIMRKDVGVDGDAQRIGQLVWLLFLKIWNDREQELELLEEDFASPLVDVTWMEEGRPAQQKTCAGVLGPLTGKVPPAIDCSLSSTIRCFLRSRVWRLIRRVGKRMRG